jgi:ubiquinone/menaquinone biosynthesis C-methylase UbiE
MSTSTISPPPQALRLISDDQKAIAYETTGGLVTFQFAAHNLSLILPLSQNAVVHDNACGTGIVSRLLLANGNPQNITIHATDIDSAFISALSTRAETNGWPVQVSNQKMQTLSFGDEFFDVSVMNLGIFFSPNAGLDGAKEIYRTLKPGGTAVVNCWEDNGWIVPSKVTHEKMRPGKAFPLPTVEWSDGKHMKNIMVKAGFKEDDLRVERSEAWAELKRDGLRDWAEKMWAYMGGVAGWLETDEQTWHEALDIFIELLLAQPGTEVEGDEVRIKGSQWVVVAKK